MNEAELVKWKREEIAYHDLAAGGYDANVREWAIYREILIDKCLNFLKDKNKNKTLILDCGCGNGAVTFRIAKENADIIAMDSSMEMVKIVKEKIGRFWLQNIFPLVADSENLPFKDCSFDCIIISGVLHHIPEIEKALEEGARILKKEGALFILEPSDDIPFISKAFIFFIRLPVEFFIKTLKRMMGREVIGMSARERPISNKVVLKKLQTLGLKCDLESFIHIPLIYAILSKRLTLLLMALVNRLFKRKKGDMFILAGKRDVQDV